MSDDRAGRFCPDERGWVAVPVGEEVGDVTPESGLAREARPTKRSAGEDAEQTTWSWLSQLALVGVK